MVSFAWNWKKRKKKLNQQFNVTVHLESLESCQMANYTPSGPSMQVKLSYKEQKTPWSQMGASPFTELCLAFCSSDALIPSSCLYILCASGSTGAHRMETAR